MNWFLLNMPLAAAFFAAWVGIPLWLVFKRPDQNSQPVAKQAARHRAAAAKPQPAPAAQPGKHLAGVG